jgi:maltooligosyltrehalose trehalohydrolase
MTHTFRVWAPRAKAVAVRLGDTDYPLDPQEGGWWRRRVPEAEPGMDYGFLLSGSEQPLPDPRSPWQPHGPHGLSRLVDPDFPWSDQRWQSPPLAAAVIYEIHIGTFTPEGTFEAAIARLPELVELGVTHVEIMPVAEFPGRRGWGYDGVNLYAPHSGYGGPVGLKRLVNALHAHGLGAILDVVYNHFGPDGNYTSSYAPYHTSRYKTPWGDAINLDGPHSDEVRRYFSDNARMWLRDYHFDGLRLDAVQALIDHSATHFLEELAEAVHDLEAQLGRHLFLIAETNQNDPRLVRRPEVGGYGLEAQWSDDFHHAIHSLLTGEQDSYYADFGSFDQVQRALKSPYVYAGDYSPFHQRMQGRDPGLLPGYHFVTFIQNHDQIGNRACGERLGHLVSAGQQKIAAALLLTSPYVPMLFQGEEWAATTPFQYFTAHTDPALAITVSEGRRRDYAFREDPDFYVPDPEDEATFTRSQLNWEERARDEHAEMLAWYRALIRFRRSSPELQSGDRRDVHLDGDAAAGWLTVRRCDDLVVANLAPEPQTLMLPTGPWALRLASAPVKFAAPKLELPGHSVAILQLED